ncbi:hypothetical protein [Acuticoccus sp. I52.16.1]|uniref:hypothetical protein n=1 Tax=Acuticoccus sp. I52.16.1 TaxID=2928472 RepID=UPI001FD3BD43|nr:hypothetical protein [Acuticoccus sp. I52.16.1]UOM36762.1 hypothetical protein MRB58_11500 [Acuticoccus sp. I52.16.1]
MEQLSSLISFAISPLGIAFAGLGGLVLMQARANPLLPWLALGSLVFAASLSRFVNEWYPNPPSFFGPIDMLVGNGRPLTIILLAIMVLMPVRYLRAPAGLPPFAFALLTAHLVIALKTFSGGSISFALLSAVTTGLIFFIFSQVGPRWIGQDGDIDRAIVAVAAAITAFTALNAVQYVLGPQALAVANGRFNGTTGNPQHAAAFLGAGIPALVYVALTRGFIWKLAALGTAAVAAYFLMWTGSRTGLLIGAAATMLLLRRSGAVAIGTGALATIAGLYVILTTPPGDFALDRLVSTENTRGGVWAALWQSFQNNPLTGMSLTGDRLGFGESSWLAMAATTGLLGLLPLLASGAMLLKIATQLLLGSAPTRRAQLQGDFAGGVVVSLIIGSIFEAFLLSAMSAATMLLLLVGIIGVRRLDINARTKCSARRPGAQPLPGTAQRKRLYPPPRPLAPRPRP